MKMGFLVRTGIDMPRTKDSIGSISKEFPIDTIDQTILAIHPGMSYAELRDYARRETNVDIPALLRQRFLLVENNVITYDLFLSPLQQQAHRVLQQTHRV
jgi:hypothetical protein